MPSLDEVNLTIPVLVTFVREGQHYPCYVKLEHDGAVLVGVGFLPSREMQPFRPERIVLDEHKLALYPAAFGIAAFYGYSAPIVLD